MTPLFGQAIQLPLREGLNSRRLATSSHQSIPDYKSAAVIFGRICVVFVVKRRIHQRPRWESIVVRGVHERRLAGSCTTEVSLRVSDERGGIESMAAHKTMDKILPYPHSRQGEGGACTPYNAGYRWTKQTDHTQDATFVIKHYPGNYCVSWSANMLHLKA